MAGVINVDTLKADSNLKLQIASANVAFIDANGLTIVGNSLNVGGGRIVVTSNNSISTPTVIGANLVTVSGTTALGIAANGQITTANAPFILTGGGITFPATAVPSADANTLDDYEEGTWTPSYTGSITNPTISQVTSGSYTKIGRFVFVTANLHTNSITSVGSGDLRISGLPFAVGNQNSSYGASIGLSVFFNTNPGAVQSESSQTYIGLYRNINNTVSPTSDLQAGTFNNAFRFSFAYIV